MAKRRYGPYEFELTHPHKVLFPEAGLSKSDLLAYYDQIAPAMLPHLRDRPLTQQRFPDGIEAAGFYQKQAPGHLPSWVRTSRVPIHDGVQTQVLCQNRATLAYLTQLNCITHHVWLSRIDRPNHPHLLILDLDPSGDDFEPVRWTAQRCRRLFDQLRLESFVALTGSRGVHVAVPLARGASFPEVKRFARGVAGVLAHRHPDRLTVEQRVEKRGRRLYLDTSRNAIGQTVVCPYTVRARRGAPVATTITWNELERRDLTAQSFDTRTVLGLLDEREDPWKGMGRRGRSLTRPRERLDALAPTPTPR